MSSRLVARCLLTGEIVTGDAAFREFFGVSHPTLQGCTLDGLIGSTSTDSVRAHFDEVAESGLPCVIETAVSCSAGAEKLVQWVCQPIRVGTQCQIELVGRVVSVARDDCALAQRHALQERIGNILNQSSETTVVDDILEEICTSFESPAGLIGHQVGKGFVCAAIRTGQPDLQPPFAPGPEWGQAWEDVLRTATPHLENSLTKSSALGRVMAAPIVHRNQVIGCIQLAARSTDYLHEDKVLLEQVLFQVAPVLAAQRELQERHPLGTTPSDSQSHLHLVDKLLAGVVYVEGDRISCNPAAVELADTESSALVTVQDWFVSLFGDDAKGVQRRYERERQGGFQRTFVTQTVQKNRAAQRLEWTCSRTDECELWILTDVTEREAAAKSRFLETMSHEVRTPMNAVIGTAALLRDSELSEEQFEYLETIRSSGDALLTIFNDILDFSKIESGWMELEEVEFDLPTTVEEAVELVAEAAQAKGIEIVCEIDPAVPDRLSGDPGRLRQVLLQLLRNAVKFTDAGEVFARVQVVDAKEGRSGLRFEVQDTGIGIAPEVQGELFSVFTQADASTTRRFGGTGIGLAISRRLVEAMGGEIEFESSLGHGSTFRFTIPLQKVGPNESPSLANTVFRGIRVLVVDDNSTVRAVLRRQLESVGMIVRDVSSAVDGFWFLREASIGHESFDLVIVDRGMPDIGGVEFTRRILSDPTIPRPPIVLMVPPAGRSEAIEARDHGVTLHLIKPVRRRQLYRWLRVALGHPEEWDPRLISLPEFVRPFVQQRILLAEDNRINQRIAKRMLERIGHDVDVAANGVEAVAAVARKDYDIVLMDCQMPEMDGYEATRRIHAETTGADRPVIIALTANALVGDRERCLAVGMDDYISKPVCMEVLEEVLRHWSRP